MLKHIFEIIAMIMMAIMVSIIAIITAPPEWGVESVDNEFGDPIKYVAGYKDSVGIMIKYHDSIPAKLSYYTVDIAESTGVIGVADVRIQDSNYKQYITVWNYVGYNNRLQTDSYMVHGKHSELLTKLIRSNDHIKVLLIDSAGDYVVKTIRCGGFDKICKKVRKK